MIGLERARKHLTDLGLNEAAGILDSRLEAAAKEERPYVEFLADLLDAEMAARRSRYL